MLVLYLTSRNTSANFAKKFGRLRRPASGTRRPAKAEKIVYPGGFVSTPPQYMFDHLKEARIEVENDHFP